MVFFKSFRFWLAWLFLISYFHVSGSTKDSLENIVRSKKEVKEKIKLLTDFTWELGKTDPETALYFGHKGLVLAKGESYVIEKANLFNNMGEAFLNLGKNDSALFYHQKAYAIRKKRTDKKALSVSILNIGVCYEYMGNYDTAIILYEKAIALKKPLKDFAGVSRSLNNIAIVYAQKGNYSVAVEYFLRALKIDEQIKDTVEMSTKMSNVGITFNYLKKYDLALKYFKKAIPITNEKNNPTGATRLFINIGVVYADMQIHDSAYLYYKRAEKIVERTENKNSKAVIYNNLAQYFNVKMEFDSAIHYGEKALVLRDEMKDLHGMAGTLNVLASARYNKGDIRQAIILSERALRISLELKLLDRQKLIYETLASCYMKTGEYKKALEYHILFKEKADSIFNDENRELITQNELQYQFGKIQLRDSIKNAEMQKVKDAEIARRKVESENQELELQNKRITQYILFGGLGLLLVFSVFIYNRFTVTRKQKSIIEKQKEIVEKQKTEVEHQKEIVEEKNKEILDSITYAKRLQDAILPPLKVVKEYLPESFILYKPKDIVAGDFYFMEPVNSKIIIAAADCTGHGVPGAMVSVVCSNALNRAVKEFKLIDAGEILNKVRDLVLETFAKSESEVKDGMDISLCVLETMDNTLVWSGANNPLWIVRSNEVVEYKADKQPIGKSYEPTPFTTHTIQLKENDIIYIFTDGYVDQFGGEKGKKFKASKMKELFQFIQNKSMDEQRIIINDAFEDWKGDLEQVDDVCIIGIKI